MKYRRFGYRRNSKVFGAVCVMIIMLITILLADASLRPAIYDLAALEAQAVAAKTVHNAVYEMIAKEGVPYGEIVSISRNGNGDITGITTDIVKMNMFKSQVTNAVDNTFSLQDRVDISVPLGSASGITLFSGFGPDINVKVGIATSTCSDFKNIFESAGINQTQHSVMLNLDTQVILTMSGRRINKKISTSFCVAQTVIVGSVPKVMVE